MTKNNLVLYLLLKKNIKYVQNPIKRYNSHYWIDTFRG